MVARDFNREAEAGLPELCSETQSQTRKKKKETLLGLPHGTRVQSTHHPNDSEVVLLRQKGGAHACSESCWLTEDFYT